MSLLTKTQEVRVNKPNIYVGLTLGVIAAALIVPPAAAQDEETTVNTRTTVKARASRLVGQVVAPFDTGNAEDRPCESGRSIVVSMKSRDGRFKRVAGAETSEEAAWRAAVPRSNAVYKIRVQPADFTFTPQYGVVEEGRCLPTTITGRLADGRFRVLTGVLGTRITRGSGGAEDGALPRTGPSSAATLVGLGLVGSGSLMLAVGRRRKHD